MAVPLRVLLVEDEESHAAAMVADLQRGDCELKTERVWTEAAFQNALKQGGCEVPFIFVSGQMDEDAAVAALRGEAAEKRAQERRQQEELLAFGRDDAVREPLPMGKGETILVVDDEPGILGSTSRLLERHNYKVLSAADGAEALTLFSCHRGRVRLIVRRRDDAGDGWPHVGARGQEDRRGREDHCLQRPGTRRQVRRTMRAGSERLPPKLYTAEKLLQTLRDLLAGEPTTHA